MATVTYEIGSASTSNTNTYSTSNFAPATGDLLVAFVVASATVAAGSFSTTAGTTFTKVTSEVKATSADTLYCFVANTAATSASQAASFTCTGDNATSCLISVFSITGMSRYGLSAIRQFKGQSNQAASTTPAPVFDAAALTENPCLGFVGNGTNTAGVTEPSSWTESADTGIGSPNTGSEVCFINSGFTGTTVTWGSTSASEFGSIIIELDTSIVSTWLERWRGVKRPRATYRRM